MQDIFRSKFLYQKGSISIFSDNFLFLYFNTQKGRNQFRNTRNGFQNSGARYCLGRHADGSSRSERQAGRVRQGGGGRQPQVRPRAIIC